MTWRAVTLTARQVRITSMGMTLFLFHLILTPCASLACSLFFLRVFSPHLLLVRSLRLHTCTHHPLSMTLDDTARVASARFVGNHRSAVLTLPLASFEVDRVTPRLNAASDLPVAHASGGCGCAIRGGCCRELSHVTIKVHLHRKALPDRFHSHDAHPHALHVHKADMEGGRERERGGGHEVRRLKHERESERAREREETNARIALFALNTGTTAGQVNPLLFEQPRILAREGFPHRRALCVLLRAAGASRCSGLRGAPKCFLHRCLARGRCGAEHSDGGVGSKIKQLSQHSRFR